MKIVPLFLAALCISATITDCFVLFNLRHASIGVQAFYTAITLVTCMGAIEWTKDYLATEDKN